MIVLICVQLGIPIPIMNEDRDSMHIFDSEQEAKEFAESHLLCVASETSMINLHTGEIELL